MGNPFFLFLDEQYAQKGGPIEGRVTSLTGLLVPPAAHSRFRSQYYSLLAKTIASPPGTISFPPTIHASNLLPELKSDEARLAFVRQFVQIIVRQKYRIYRLGYVWTPKMRDAFQKEISSVGLCFMGLLGEVTARHPAHLIWPVMETDHSQIQDRMTAGFVRKLDYLTPQMPRRTVTLSNKGLGEVLFCTKQSAYGAAVDLVSYLRGIAYRKRESLPLSEFKEKLHDIGKSLEASVVYDRTITMEIR